MGVPRIALALTAALAAVFSGACASSRTASVVAHRGGAALAPENTLAALRQALELGAPCVEIDLRQSADGVVMVFHDATLERTSNGVGELALANSAALARLDAGAWKDARFAGEPIPTLASALELCRGRTEVMLDVKVAGLGAATRAAVERSGFALDELWIGTWDDEQLADLRAEFPSERHVFIGEAPPELSGAALGAWLDGLRARGYCAVSLSWKSLPRELVPMARSRQLSIFVWTLNEPEQLRAAIALGVDGVITDRPDSALALVR